MSSRAAIWGNASKCLSVGERSDGGMQCPARRRWRLLPQGRKKPMTWTSQATKSSEGFNLNDIANDNENEWAHRKRGKR